MSQMMHGLSRLDQLMKTCLNGDGPAADFPQSFGRLLDANPVQLANLNDQQLVDIYDALVETMRATEVEDGPADAGMTFLGQFVDHDITLDATSALGTRIDPATIRNVRTPALDLDCVYGAGPEASGHLYGKDDQDHFLMFGHKDNKLDLARTGAGKALIGDFRNDENIIVSQIQGAFICLHNILMSRLKDDEGVKHDVSNCAHMGVDGTAWERYVPEKLMNFEEVRRFIRLHYQWVVWHEMLPAFVDQACLDAALENDHFGADAAIMPVEFSGAAYRFGHATTQAKYHLKSGDTALGLFATLGFGKRPLKGNLDFDQFFAMNGADCQKARPVGTKLGSPLFELPFVTKGMLLEGPDVMIDPAQAKKLALRNILRDRYTYELMDGQRAAKHLGLTPLPVHPTLAERGITKTPLWFYLLEEADKAGTGKLTGVGGTIVASVMARLLRLDPSSVFHVKGFQPWSGFEGQPSVMAGMMAYVEAHRDSITNPEGLWSD